MKNILPLWSYPGKMEALRVIRVAPGRSGKPLAVFVLFNNVLSLSSSLFLGRVLGRHARSPSFKSKNFQLPNSPLDDCGVRATTNRVAAFPPAMNGTDRERGMAQAQSGLPVGRRLDQIRLHLASLHFHLATTLLSHKNFAFW